jgi:hypothetical protein
MTINLVVFQPYVTKLNISAETLQHIFTFIFQMLAIGRKHRCLEGLAGDRAGARNRVSGDIFGEQPPNLAETGFHSCQGA